MSTGAFDTVEADRSVSLETAGDANAFLGMTSLNEDVVDPDTELIGFEIPESASVTYEELVLVTNQGTQAVTSLRFEFAVTGADQPDADVEDALRIVSPDPDTDGVTEIDAVDEANLIAESNAEDAENNELVPGESFPFGIRIDLTDVEIDEITGDPDITLTIIAESGEVNDGDDGDGPGGVSRFVFSTGDPTAYPPDAMEFTVENRGPDATIEGFRVEVTGTNPPTSFTEYELETTGDPETVREAEREDDPFEVNADVDHDPYTLPPGGEVEYSLEGFDENTQSLLSNEPDDFTFVLLTADGPADVAPSGET